MKKVALILVCLTLASCAVKRPVAADPIDKLVAQYDASHGLWVNGVYPIVELPSDAKPKEVLAKSVKVWGFDRGHITTYKILEIRELSELKVGENRPPYMAALIESDLGKKIFLFRPGKNNRWWTRFCDVSEEN